MTVYSCGTCGVARDDLDCAGKHIPSNLFGSCADFYQYGLYLLLFGPSAGATPTEDANRYETLTEAMRAVFVRRFVSAKAPMVRRWIVQAEFGVSRGVICYLWCT